MEAMARRRKRDLSAEEKRLWEHVARHVTPLPGRGGDRMRDSHEADDGLMHSTASFTAHGALPDVAAIPGPGTGEARGKGEGRGKGQARAAGDGPAPKFEQPIPARPVLPAYIPPVSRKGEALPAGTGSGGLDRKERRALRRRVREVDDRLDLHGMRQEEAHRALIRFLQSASARDCAIVLVVTGKGGVGGPGYGDERGVLRRITPHWLRAPELKPFVVGFEEAAAHHGGAGALYVRLRRRGR
jgi:DNA-nicking Smr family endonuclease